MTIATTVGTSVEATESGYSSLRELPKWLHLPLFFFTDHDPLFCVEILVLVIVYEVLMEWVFFYMTQAGYQDKYILNPYLLPRLVGHGTLHDW